MIRMVFSATLPTIEALTSCVSSPPSFLYSAASETSHTFSESTRVPSMSHRTAFMTHSPPPPNRGTAPDSVSAGFDDAVTAQSSGL